MGFVGFRGFRVYGTGRLYRVYTALGEGFSVQQP